MFQQKFIVVADAHSREPLAIFFDPHLPSMHIELLRKARAIWSKLGRSIIPLGGGMLAIIDKHVVFYAESKDLGPFDDGVVLQLAPNHPLFAKQNFTFYSRVGQSDPEKILKEFSYL